MVGGVGGMRRPLWGAALGKNSRISVGNAVRARNHERVVEGRERGVRRRRDFRIGAPLRSPAAELLCDWSLPPRGQQPYVPWRIARLKKQLERSQTLIQHLT